MLIPKHSRDLVHNRVAAVKVIDIDTQDHKGPILHKDSTITDTSHEIKVLQQLQDAKAKNINPFFAAFAIHSQFWIVTDYCPGGSVSTLVSLDPASSGNNCITASIRIL